MVASVVTMSWFPDASRMLVKVWLLLLFVPAFAIAVARRGLPIHAHTYIYFSQPSSMKNQCLVVLLRL
jgi:hypothetical protein